MVRWTPGTAARPTPQSPRTPGARISVSAFLLSGSRPLAHPVPPPLAISVRFYRTPDATSPGSTSAQPAQHSPATLDPALLVRQTAADDQPECGQAARRERPASPAPGRTPACPPASLRVRPGSSPAEALGTLPPDRHDLDDVELAGPRRSPNACSTFATRVFSRMV